jgi:hypothetical protein
MATTWFAQANAAWDAANEWNDVANGSGNFGTPGDGDTCDLQNYIVSWSSTGRIPLTGTLLLLRSGATNTGTGQITLATGAATYALLSTTIQAGYKPTATGFIRITGSNNSAIVNITASSGIFGGGNAAAAAIVLLTTGGGGAAFNITANVTGGSSTTTYGILGGGYGVINIIGNLTGGSVYSAHGIMVQATTQTWTLNGNMISGVALPAAGSAPTTWSQAGSVAGAQYIQMIAAGTKYGQEPVAANLIEGIQCGDILGTYHAPERGEVKSGAVVGVTTGTRIDCPVAQAQKTNTPYYGDPDALVDGTYVTPSDADVKLGVANGVSPGAGTYNPTSSVIIIED